MSFCIDTRFHAARKPAHAALWLWVLLTASLFSVFTAAASETGTAPTGSLGIYSFAAKMAEPPEGSLTPLNTLDAAAGRYMLLEPPAATTEATAANEPALTPALEYEPATEAANSVPTPTVFYEPKYRSNWTWPGYPDTEALRRHLLSDRVNHGEMNNTDAKRATIRKLTGWQLRQLHASHHDRMLQPELITMMKILDNETTTTTTATTTTATTTTSTADCPDGNCPTGTLSWTNLSNSDCPSGNCPTAGTMLYQPRLRARRQTRRLLRWR